MEIPKQSVANNVFKPRWFQKHEKDSQFNIFGEKKFDITDSRFKFFKILLVLF